jgi:large subunit ribosomal protein L14
MVQTQSRLKVADNSGAKLVQVIRVLGSSNKQFGRLGDTISVSVKKALPNGTVRNHDKAIAVIVRVKKEQRRKDGSYIRFDENACVIIDKKSKDPKGTAVFGPIAKEVKERGYNKVASLAPEVI